jgi:hypothetical protein
MAAQEVIRQTLETWQPYYEQELTEQDGEEILDNWAAYIGLISEWVAAAGEWDDPE